MLHSLNSLHLKRFDNVCILLHRVCAALSAFPSNDSAYDTVWYKPCMCVGYLGVQSNIWIISRDPNCVGGCNRRSSKSRAQSSANKGRFVYKRTYSHSYTRTPTLANVFFLYNSTIKFIFNSGLTAAWLVINVLCQVQFCRSICYYVAKQLMCRKISLPSLGAAAV